MEQLIAALPPIVAAAITGLITYLTTRSKDKLTLAEKEHDYLNKERDRMAAMFEHRNTALETENKHLESIVDNLRGQIQTLDDKEECCQHDLLESSYRIRELESEIRRLKENK